MPVSREAAHKGGFLALVVSILIALGLWAPSPVPPQPTPSPTATATPEPTVEPTALPTPPPVVEACQLPPSTGKCVFPPTVHPRFTHAVEDAQASVPERFFDVDGRVLDEGEYVLEVARRLRVTSGLCAIQGTSVFDEVWVKDSNGFSEHWDIVRADGHPITLYAARCAPAAF